MSVERVLQLPHEWTENVLRHGQTEDHISLPLSLAFVCILAYDQPRNYGYNVAANGSIQVGSEQSVWKSRRSGR